MEVGAGSNRLQPNGALRGAVVVSGVRRGTQLEDFSFSGW